nr:MULTISPECIES: HAMP domain-containing sensor histidine kinase [unclassified Clostridium]
MDISDEIKRELELEKLKIYDKEKSDFISNISHELKTPLNIFYSTVQLLDSAADKECISFKSTYKKYNKSLHINCKRMLRLINNIMDISMIDMGILKADFRNYDIVFLIEEVTLSVVNYALSKSIVLQFDTNVEEHIIKCDASMIERAILNLLSNAIKFSKENKSIYVNVLVEDEFVRIDIKDEGIGISDESKEFIFDRFVQVDKSFSRMNEGCGIGLSIVKALVNLHGGQVFVDSTVNEGSTFTVLLPNELLNNTEMNLYDNDINNTELELSDIYELLNK